MVQNGNRATDQSGGERVIAQKLRYLKKRTRAAMLGSNGTFLEHAMKERKT